MAKTEQYKKEYCQMLIDHMSTGMSFGSFGGTIGHGRTTLYDWLDKHEEFREAYEIATSKALFMFETILISKARGIETKGIDLKKSDTACAIFALKTRFKEFYSEKHEVDFSEEVKGILKLNYKV